MLAGGRELSDEAGELMLEKVKLTLGIERLDSRQFTLACPEARR